MNLGTSLVEFAAHGEILNNSGKSGCFALVALLLLHSGDVEDLENDNGPKDAPNNQDSLESIDLMLY